MIQINYNNKLKIISKETVQQPLYLQNLLKLRILLQKRKKLIDILLTTLLSLSLFFEEIIYL